MPYYLKELGYIPNRDWTKIITEDKFSIESFERKMNGTIYLYVLRNDKKESWTINLFIIKKEFYLKYIKSDVDCLAQEFQPYIGPVCCGRVISSRVVTKEGGGREKAQRNRTHLC